MSPLSPSDLARANWNSVRLELARTPEFPEGSAAHAYLLRLPLGPDGLVDLQRLSRLPAEATVHRHWPGEPDRSGYVIKGPKGWAMSYRPGEEDDETVFHLETHPFRLGEYVTLTEPDGRQLPYRVVSLARVEAPGFGSGG